MAKTKISEFSSTPANNTDIDSINIAEGCAPSGINDAIRELMAQLKDFQTGAQGDSFNGPIGTSTAAAGAFTTLSATGAITSTLATGTAPLVIASTTKVSNLNVDLLDGADWASPAALGSTTPAAVSATTLSASSTVTLSGGTANGVTYLNGSKVVTSGSALTFDGTSLGVGIASPTFADGKGIHINNAVGSARLHLTSQTSGSASTDGSEFTVAGSDLYIINNESAATIFYNAGSEQMRLTSTGLGIGTSSPSSKLQVNGEARFTDGTSTVKIVNSSAIGFFGTLSNHPLAFITNDTERARIDSSGNFGIGTSSPNGTLQLSRNASSGNFLVFDDTRSGYGDWAVYKVGANDLTFGYDTTAGSAPTQALTLAYGGNVGIGTSSPANKLDVRTGTTGNIATFFGTSTYHLAIEEVGGVMFLDANNGNATIGFKTNDTERMRLDSSGNLGIGTSSPAAKFHVAISSGPYVARFENTSTSTSQYNTALFYQGATGSAVGYIGTGGSAVGNTAFANNFVVGTQSSSPLVFTTNDTERARIDSSGNLLVGTTGQTLGTARLCVSSSGLTTVSTTSTSTESPYASFNTATSGNNQFMWFYTGDSGQTFRGSIEYNRGGGVVAYNTTSDYRLKENIVDLPNALATVAQLKPRQFDWKETGNTTTGFIAHELAEVVPHAVTGEKDAVDENGNPKYQGIDTSFLVATLTAAIQEQQAIINSLKARLDAANL